MTKRSQNEGKPIEYLAFLRGINVGGHKIIKMTELARIFSSLGFKDVRTYIQSGNVFFTTVEEDEAALTANIEQGLSKALGFDVPVLLRTVSGLHRMIAKYPFVGKQPSDMVKFYVAFLSEEPQPASARELLSRNSDFEMFRVLKREVFIQCRKDPAIRRNYVMDSLEKILGVRATIRNWETLHKMLGE